MENDLTAEDRELIARAVAAMPDVDHRILDIALEEPGRFRVRTGWIKGPKYGSGQFLWATKNSKGEWVVELAGGWMA
jgi:hypothetical protein